MIHPSFRVKNCLFILSLLFFFHSGSAKDFLLLKGSIDTELSSKTDSVYVGIGWHGNDRWIRNGTISQEIGIVKNGRFRLRLSTPPEEGSRLNLPTASMSVGFIFAFKDLDGDRKFTNNDQIIGLCEEHTLVYMEGEWQQALTAAQEKKGEEIKTLWKLAPGMQACQVVKSAEGTRGFDDLVPVKKAKVLIRTVEGAGRKIKAPNWT